MKNTRYNSSVTQLAKRKHPFRIRFITFVYLDATKKPYTYLLPDLRRETPDEIRIIGYIFCDPITIYVQK